MSEWAVRLPSLIAGTALIPLLFWIVWRWTDSPVCGLLSAFLAAIEPNFVFFSLEARPYAVVQVLGLLQMFVFWNVLVRPNWKNRGSWIALSAVLFYTHYTAILLLPAEIVVLLYMQLLRNWRSDYRGAAIVTDLTAIALLLLPAAPHLWAISERRDNWWLFVSVPTSLAGLEMFPMYVTPVLVAGGAVAYTFITKRRISNRWRQIGRLLILMIVVILAVVFIAYMSTKYGIAPLWMRRYMIVAATPPIIVAGLSCALPENLHVRREACLLTALVALFWTIPPWHWSDATAFYPHSEENWRDAVALIKDDDEARDWPVLVRSGLIEANGLIESNDAALREYCLLPVKSIYSLGDDRVAIPLAASMPGRIKDDDVKRLAGGDGVWLMTPGGEEVAEATLKLVKRRLERGGMRPGQETAEAFGRVWVMRVPLK